jgi:hypothetical protein
MGSKNMKKQTYPVFYSGFACVFRSQISAKIPCRSGGIFLLKFGFFKFWYSVGFFGIAFWEKMNIKKLTLPKDCLATPQCKSKMKSFSGFNWPSY